MLSSNEIMEILGANREGLRRDFGAESMALFGSAARGDAGPLSDVDVLVEIPKPISLFELVALQLRLQELLTVPKVDVVLRDAIFPPLRDAILADLPRRRLGSGRKSKAPIQPTRLSDAPFSHFRL